MAIGSFLSMADAMKKAVAFVGPSFAGNIPEDVFSENVFLCPPVRRGDLGRLAPSISSVLIIDGVFHSALAVSAREILNTLRRGVTVYGSSSMGALRAAELDEFGMVGVGKVYQMYKSGEAESDAEVALIFDEESFVPLSEPLVNIRHSVAKAVERACLLPTDGDQIISRAKTLRYHDLTFETLFDLLSVHMAPGKLAPYRQFVRHHLAEMDLKRRDAIELAEYFKAYSGRSIFESDAS